MSTNGVNTTKTNIFKRFGNWFGKHGAQVGGAMMATGSAATSFAMGAYALNQVGKNGSIFGCGGCGGYGGYGGCGNSMMQMMMMSSMMGGASLFGAGMFDPSSAMYGGMYTGGMNPYSGIMDAYALGVNTRQQVQAQGFANMYGNNSNNWWGSAFNNTSAFGNTAGKIAEQKKLTYTSSEDDNSAIGTNKDKGQSLDSATDDLGNGTENEIELEIDSDGDGTISNDEYKNGLSDYSKSYIANIDSDNDGLISEAEFVKHETAKAPSGVSDENAEQMAKNAFAKLDRNNSGKIDYKEMASLFGYMSSSKGKITANNYKSVSQTLANGNDTKFVSKLDKEYSSLFGEPKKTDES